MTLDQLTEKVGADGMRRLVTEYIMLVIAKADRLDEIQHAVSEGGTMKDVRRILDN